MAEDPDNVVLVYLRHIDQKVDQVAEDVRDIKIRLSAVESQIGYLQSQNGTLNSRMDRIEDRLERIEKRLDLTDA